VNELERKPQLVSDKASYDFKDSVYHVEVGYTDMEIIQN